MFRNFFKELFSKAPNLPSLNILSAPLRLELKGTSVDYRIRYDITGKIYEVQPLVFELPKMAQQLILGKNSEEMVAKIYATSDLVQLMLPLGIVEQVPFLQEALKNIVATIDEEIENQGILKKNLYQLAEKESVAFYILSSYQSPEQEHGRFREVWERTIKLLKNRAGDNIVSDLQFIGYYYPQFYLKILSLFIPFINNSHAKGSVYEQLKNYIDEKCTSYLLEQLAICKNDKDGIACRGIFEALSRQTIKAIPIQDILVDYYHADIDLSKSAKVSLMEALKHFPNERTFTIGRAIVKENTDASTGAARILLDIGFPPQKIADFFLPKLLATDPRESEIAFSIFSISDQLTKYLPSITDLLKIYIRIMNKRCSGNIASSMSNIIKIKYPASTFSEITDYLENDNPKLLIGILELISRLLYKSGVDSEPFTTSSLRVRYLELMSHEHRSVSECAIKIVEKIGMKERNGYYILILLKIMDLDNKAYKNLIVMRVINRLTVKTGYQDRMTAIYLKAIEMKDSAYRVAALKGLRHTKDLKLKKSLLYLKDDPDKEIRRIIKTVQSSIEVYELLNPKS